MSTFLTIVGVMILNSILTTAFMCGGIEVIYEKIEQRRKQEEDKKPKEETKWN
mgnify:CR=1 FL=1